MDAGWSSAYLVIVTATSIPRSWPFCATRRKGLERVIFRVYPDIPLQGCTTHLKRGMLGKVRHGDKRALADDMRCVFRRVTRMRGAIPNEESVLVLMGKTAMDTSYNRILPGITTDRTLFPSTAENNSIDENVVCVIHGMK